MCEFHTESVSIRANFLAFLSHSQFHHAIRTCFDLCFAAAAAEKKKKSNSLIGYVLCHRMRINFS